MVGGYVILQRTSENKEKVTQAISPVFQELQEEKNCFQLTVLSISFRNQSLSSFQTYHLHGHAIFHERGHIQVVHQVVRAPLNRLVLGNGRPRFVYHLAS